MTHASQNHGYDPFLKIEEPEYIHGIRSMSVGDVIEVDDTYFQVKTIGFEEIEVLEGGEEQK